uniref:protein-tyrosine-phosphatase n=1 Tax=Phallusia mammillata TaxID=59560 RepID=A0A6F9DQG9_9ASCI|nr:tyrosine-protein phosphatase non-receptor type 2-like [Phallusia mammillata]
MKANVDRIVAEIEQQHHGWERLFHEIKLTAANYELPCKVAKLQVNRLRNRYRDVSPYDHSRVKLLDGPSDYINSSLVEVETAGRQYILSQGPLPSTAGHLWQMVWEQNSKAVIMLNKVIEKGARKCHQYWPLEMEMPMTFAEDGYEIELISEDNMANFIVRTLKLSRLDSSEEDRIIYQFHYIAWPDFGVPESPNAFLEFLTCVRSKKVLENDVGPPVIHCSAGIGRSGTFALVDTCLVFLEKNIPFDIKDTLLEMRKYRMGLIQTAQQLRFSYLAIAECARRLMDDKDGHFTSSSVSDSESDDSEDGSQKSDGEHQENGDGVSEEKPENNRDSESKDNRKRHAEKDAEATEEKRGKQEETTLPVTETVETVPKEHNNNVSDLRRRQRQEKTEATFKKIEEIKSNMQSNEKRPSWRPYIIGGLIAGVVVGLAVRYWFR